VDLRKTLASSILVVGGTAMLPGFIPRLHGELLRAIAPPPASPRQPTRPDTPLPPQYDRYASLRPLVPYFAILNNPLPPLPMSERAANNAGKSPAFSPATMAWIGGSLAGSVTSHLSSVHNQIDTAISRSLKTGGVEVAREKWDEANTNHDPDTNMDVSADFEDRTARNILPDWTRTPLPSGAPPAISNLRQTEVGA
jgi:actin-related protein 10